MLVNREKLENELKIILQYYNSKKKIKEKIINRFQEFGFLYGEINAIISGTNPLMQLQDELLWLLVIILYEFIEDEYKVKINPDKILTDFEIKTAKNIRIDREKDALYPIVFENVNKDADDDYSSIFTIEKISELYDNRTFKYNYETQRPRISKWYGGKEVKEIHLNEKAKKSITKNILDGTQIPDEITLNILDNEERQIEYDPMSRTLTVLSGNVDLIDGWHRSLSARNAHKVNPNIGFYLKVRIVSWEIDKAKAFIHQKSLGTLLDPLAKKVYDVYNPVNQVVKKLNEDVRSILRGKITTERNMIENKKALVMFNVLFDSISQIFEFGSNKDTTQTTKDVAQIAKYLKDGISLLADNDMSLLDEEKDDRVWVSYLLVLKKYYMQENWQENVLNAVERLDQNELIEIQYKTINKPFIKKIEDFVNERLVMTNV